MGEPGGGNGPWTVTPPNPPTPPQRSPRHLKRFQFSNPIKGQKDSCPALIERAMAGARNKRSVSVRTAIRKRWRIGTGCGGGAAGVRVLLTGLVLLCGGWGWCGATPEDDDDDVAVMAGQRDEAEAKVLEMELRALQEQGVAGARRDGKWEMAHACGRRGNRKWGGEERGAGVLGRSCRSNR
jgi:hypothetical protein